MAQSVLLPAFIALFGIVAALFLVGFTLRPASSGGEPSHEGDLDEYDEYDDDDYVEFILLREHDTKPVGRNMEPLVGWAERPRGAPAGAGHGNPVDSRPGPRGQPAAPAQPIGFAHNGSHVDTHPRFRPNAKLSARASGSAPRDERIASPSERQHNGSARNHFVQSEARSGQHHRPDPDDDSTGYGRHSSGR